MVGVKDQKLMRPLGSLPPQSSLLWGTDGVEVPGTHYVDGKSRLWVLESWA